MKRASIRSRINISLLLILILLTGLVFIHFFVRVHTNESTYRVIQEDLPVALNTLAMLEEVGNITSNLLEYVLGEEEEKGEYYANQDEFNRFRALVPEQARIKPDLERLDRLISSMHEQAVEHVFNTYSPRAEGLATDRINTLIREVGQPLEQLLDALKQEEIDDAGSSLDADAIITDDLPGVRYYLELVDEAGDMLADLDRFVLGDTDARRSFFANALAFETFLAKLKPLETKPDEQVKIAEIQRLFNELRQGGEAVFEVYKARDRHHALKTIEELEHGSLSVAKTLLEKLSDDSRRRMQSHLADAMDLSRKADLFQIFVLTLGIILLSSVFVYLRRSIHTPLLLITDTIERLKRGERDFEIPIDIENNEIGDIVRSLQQFKEQLHELDALRAKELEQSSAITEERDKLTAALDELRKTQDQLVTSEKLASLGSLVAGVAHEINTPIGVAVTLSSHYREVAEKFLERINGGTLNRSEIDQFEAETRQSFDVLAQSLSDASELIQNFKQVAVDQSSSQRREFVLSTVIEEILSTVRHKLKNTEIGVNISGNCDISMDSYPGALGQVITNLFNNSMTHGFEGTDKGLINIRCVQNGDHATIYYRDDGSGIEIENLPHVFEPFFTTKQGEGGSGLGLNIVHNIVTRILGGDIAVSSSVGAEFEILLPIVAPDYSRRMKQ